MKLILHMLPDASAQEYVLLYRAVQRLSSVERLQSDIGATVYDAPSLTHSILTCSFTIALESRVSPYITRGESGNDNGGVG